jgi:predicted DNA-binding transcriptional regulator AlpA
LNTHRSNGFEQTAGKLLTPVEVAELYRIPISTAAKWRWNGTGPAFVKLGSRVLYRQIDIEAWIAANVRHSTTKADD